MFYFHSTAMGARLLCIVLLLSISSSLIAQQEDSIKIEKDVLDSLFIEEVENSVKTDKVLHAEPLYIDLIRDLGARKGEKEWNLGLGMFDKANYDEYEALVEYEWAPIDRLGLEVELPFSFYYPTENGVATPKSKLNSLKMAAQYSFYVSEKRKTSMAIGYIQEFEITPFANYASGKLHSGNVYNPFFIAAKRWGQNFHTLLYTGPQIVQHFSAATDINWQINSNFHYMIDGTRNFIGIEFNKSFNAGIFDMTIRPQMRVELSHNLLVGIVTGINPSNKSERISSFLRLIYEPKGKHR